MGMDVVGKSGNYFRASVWSWRPLADYMQFVAPEITSTCTHWHTNDGDGLDAAAAIALADVLDLKLTSGACASAAEDYKTAQALLPDEVCNLCEGTGIRRDKVGVSMNMPDQFVPSDDSSRRNPRAGMKGWCNGCRGAGFVRPFACNYPFDVDFVREFSEFCRKSGGFEIW
jgi:hypothetical protein